MKIRVIGRLHFLVASSSRKGLEHLVDLGIEPQPEDRRAAFCSCEAYNFNPGEYCRHIEQVVKFIQSKNYETREDSQRDRLHQRRRPKSIRRTGARTGQPAHVPRAPRDQGAGSGRV